MNQDILREAEEVAKDILSAYFAKEPRVIYVPGELTKNVTQALLTFFLKQMEPLVGRLKNVQSCLVLATTGFGPKSIDWKDLLEGVDETLAYHEYLKALSGGKG